MVRVSSESAEEIKLIAIVKQIFYSLQFYDHLLYGFNMV